VGLVASRASRGCTVVNNYSLTFRNAFRLLLAFFLVQDLSGCGSSSSSTNSSNSVNAVASCQSGGSGNQYTVCNLNDLDQYARAPGGSNTILVLGADIDAAATGSGSYVDYKGVSRKGFLPTGFTGTFEGSGHSIANLTIYADGTDSNPEMYDVGLFGRAGAISNLTLSNVKVLVPLGNVSTSASSYFVNVGTLATQASLVDSCQVSGTIEVTVPSTISLQFFLRAGGLLALQPASPQEKVSIQNSKASVNITANVAQSPSGNQEFIYLGGLVEAASGLIANSAATGNITVNVTQPSNMQQFFIQVGGLASEDYGTTGTYAGWQGTIESSSYSGQMAVSFNSNSATNDEDFVMLAGLVGEIMNGYVSNSYAKASYKVVVPSFNRNTSNAAGDFVDVGGLFEQMFYTPTENSYADFSATYTATDAKAYNNSAEFYYRVGGIASRAFWEPLPSMTYFLKNSFANFTFQSNATLNQDGALGGIFEYFSDNDATSLPYSLIQNSYWSGGPSGMCGEVPIANCDDTKRVSESQFYSASSAPLNTWDFSTLWQTQAQGLPVLR